MEYSAGGTGGSVEFGKLTAPDGRIIPVAVDRNMIGTGVTTDREMYYLGGLDVRIESGSDSRLLFFTQKIPMAHVVDGNN